MIHLALTAGALNLGTDVGIWAVGNGRAFKRNATWSGLLDPDDGVGSVPRMYPNASSLAAVAVARYPELVEMRRVVGVSNAIANGQGRTLVPIISAQCKCFLWDTLRVGI